MSSGTPPLSSKLFILNTFLYTRSSDVLFAVATRHPGAHQAVFCPNTCTTMFINIFLIWQEQNLKMLSPTSWDTTLYIKVNIPVSPCFPIIFYLDPSQGCKLRGAPTVLYAFNCTRVLSQWQEGGLSHTSTSNTLVLPLALWLQQARSKPSTTLATQLSGSQWIATVQSLTIISYNKLIFKTLEEWEVNWIAQSLEPLIQETGLP